MGLLRYDLQEVFIDLPSRHFDTTVHMQRGRLSRFEVLPQPDKSWNVEIDVTIQAHAQKTDGGYGVPLPYEPRVVTLIANNDTAVLPTGAVRLVYLRKAGVVLNVLNGTVEPLAAGQDFPAYVEAADGDYYLQGDYTADAARKDQNMVAQIIFHMVAAGQPPFNAYA